MNKIFMVMAMLGAFVFCISDAYADEEKVGALAFWSDEIAESLNDKDKRYMNEAYDRAQNEPLDVVVSWENSNNKNSGEIVAMKESKGPNGHICREFYHALYIGDNDEESVFGTACQQPDGLWTVVDDPYSVH